MNLSPTIASNMTISVSPTPRSAARTDAPAGRQARNRFLRQAFPAWRLTPLSAALSVALLAGSLAGPGSAQAAGAWFAAVGAARNASTTGAGYPSSGQTARPDTSPAQQQQANVLLQHSMQNMNSVAAAIAAQQATQAARAAQAAALQSPVTDGLAPGGLVVDPRALAGSDPNLWVNAGLPTQTVNGGQTTVTVKQNAERAVMTWQQFNVGKNTTVDFDQSGGNSANGNSWVALNRIDATGVPSQIQGQIKADGTVLLINPNGIIFSGTSQINVHSLVAAAMDINSFGGGSSPNVGVFNAAGGYNTVTLGDVSFLAPANEDSGNQSFLTSGLYTNGVTPTTGGTLVFSAPSTTIVGLNAGVQVQAGASISTAVSGFDNGGMVALLGPTVSNAGSISTSAGQIILGAGKSIYLTEPNPGSTQTRFSVANALLSTQALAYTPPAVVGGAAAVNDTTGLLTSTRGDITLVGDTVQQLGVAQATTSITRAGSITVAATDTVTFGPGSVTTILPDENGETIPSDAASLAAFVPPTIAISTTNLDMQSGSLIVAPGAAMSVTPTPVPNNGTTPPPVGRILLEAGSTIDLAGLTGVTRSVSDYLYTFKVTANDVADTPLAQGLIGQTVTIDLSQTGTRADGETWVGSPLFASSGSGYLANISQGIDQLLTKGGALTLGNANGATFTDILTAPGSTVDVSGGWIQYTGGTIKTTQLRGANGQTYDIGSADPFVAYAGLAGAYTLNHARWGVTQTYINPLIVRGVDKPGYIDGVSAGSLSLTAVNPVLEGDIDGDIVIGSNQRQLAQAGTGANGAQATPDQMPNGASLAITLKSSDPSNANPASVVLAGTASDILGPDFTLASKLALPAGDITYSTDALSAMGLGAISIKGANELSMAPGASLSVLPGGSITLTGATTLDGTLTAHAGSIAITGDTPRGGTNTAPRTSAVTLGPDALLDVSGLWVNDAGATGDTFQGAANINGGSVSITTNTESAWSGHGTFSSTYILTSATDATQSIVLAPGSVIDASSGGYVGAKGLVKTGSNGLPAGRGGNVSLVTYNGSFAEHGGYDPANGGYQLPGGGPSISSTYIAPAPTGTNLPNAANVVMDGTIHAGGLSSGGTFTLQAPTITIDGAATEVSSITSGAQAGTVVLPASFFTDSGFSQYALTSTYGSVTVAAGTSLALKQQNYQLPSNAALPATGAALRDFAGFGLVADGLRQPVSLSLTERPYADGGDDAVSSTAGILVDQGASIAADPGAAISLTAGGPVTVLGSISAPGGSITLTNNGTPYLVTATPSTVPGQPLAYSVSGTSQAPQDIWIGPDAVLDVAGVLAPDPFVPNPLIGLYATGKVLDAGSITLTSSGAIVALAGSQFNLQGASATIEMPGQGIIGSRLVAQPVWSNGGTLTLTRSSTATSDPANLLDKGLYFAGRIDAAGGTPQASGGTLNIGSTYLTGSNSSAQTAAIAYGNIVIAQSGDDSAPFAGQTVPITQGQLAALLPATKNAAFITADTLSHSGLDSVALTGPITFSGNVAVDIPGALYLNGNITLAPAGITPSSPSTAYAATPVAGGIPTIGATGVTLDAGYIRWLSGTIAKPALADGTLTLNAGSQIDLAGVTSASNAGQVNLVSGGDIRFLNGRDADVSPYLITLLAYAAANSDALSSDGNGGLPSAGALLVADNLTLTARESYPSTDTAFLLMSLGLAPSTATGTHNTIAFASNGKTPSAPLSAGGAILVDAPSIRQGGALYAPLGTIQLGYSQGQTLPQFLIGGTTSDPYDPVGNVARAFFNGAGITTAMTQDVTLAPGSLTSVSAAGLDIPYGTTVDGVNWTDGGLILNGPPDKLIVLGGAKIDTQAGAVVDASGGGDVYATEFVPGTGGSRNVLTTASQTVYALVPTAQAPVTPYDPTFGTTVAPGTSVTLPGGNGIAAGTYTLLPGMYATLPGAYRVVVASTNATPGIASFITPDGSILMTGTLGNAVTGGRSSQTALLQIQPKATWTQYSEIDIAQGNAYFAKLAATNAAITPRLASDAGHLVIAALDSLTLDADNNFAPAEGGRSGQVDITGTNLLVAASDLAPAFAANSAYSGYLVLDADQVSHLGVDSMLIGGTRTNSTAGTLINATAFNLEVATDAAHALTGPELLLVSIAPTSADPAVHGLTVDAGSAIAAKGTVSGTGTPLVIGVDPVAQRNASNTPITGYSPGVSGDGSLLRVSNGDLVSIARNFVPGLYTPPDTTPTATGPTSAIARGSLTIGSGVTLSGNTLTLDTSAQINLATDAVLTAKNYDLGANVINLGTVPAGTAGLTISPTLVATFAGAGAVRLRSATVFNLYGDSAFGSASAPIGTLTFDGSGFYSNGGTTTLSATNIAFIDSQANVSANGALTGGTGGSLIANASDTVDFGAGAKTLSGFDTASFTAGQEVLFSGAGSFDAKAANVTLAAPVLVADAGSGQSLTTTGSLALQPGTGTAPTLDPTDIGGALTLTGATVTVATQLAAQAGKLTLEATTGDVTLDGNASINAAGTRIFLFDLTEDTPGGTVKLIADSGNVTLGANTLIDVSAAGNGYAGTLGIQAASGTATLGGTLKGSAAYNDLGGNFLLSADNLIGGLPLGAFTGSFAVSLGNGDITIASDQILTSQNVLLVANNGSVNVDGTIDASGPSGGTIALYGVGTSTAAAGTAGASGVTIGSTARLYARYQADDSADPAYANGASALVQRGGTITLGTTGTPDGTLNATYGYQNVQGSGAITVAPGAIFDVSGGPGDAAGNIDNTGGSVIVRAPILTNNNINVGFKGTIITNAKADGVTPSGNGIVANAFAVWSTTDSCTLISGGCGTVTTVAQYNALTAAQKAQLNAHFDGIIDPAGFFNGAGIQIISAVNGLYPTSTASTPAAGTYLPHVGFYQTTLQNFVNDPFSGNSAAVAADFASAKLQVKQADGSTATSSLPSSMLHLRPEVDLVNPTPATGAGSINGGNITVASNWNLGAGIYNTATGAFNLFYRTTSGAEPGTLTLRAANNVQINATISDGFYETSDPFFVAAVPSGLTNASLSAATTLFTGKALWNTATYMPGGAGISPPPAEFPSSYSSVEQNTWYGLYYSVYASNLLSDLNFMNHSTSDKYITTNASGVGSFDNNPTHYSSYAAYVSAYNANYVGANYASGQSAVSFTTALGTQMLTTFDNKPTHYASYVAYAAAYNAYYNAMKTFMVSYYAANPTYTGSYPSTILAPIPPVYGAVYSGGATETASQFVTDYQTSYSGNGAANLYKSYQLYYFSNKVEPGSATGNSANTQGMALWLVALPYLPAISETPPISIATTATSGPANAIANNPAQNNATDSLGSPATIRDYNTTAAASLMTAVVSGKGSFSYDIVGGAYFAAYGASSVNPSAVVDASSLTSILTGNVTINGHTSYSNPAKTGQTIDIPTIVRTGTGSIDIAAAGSFELLDQTAPGAVYTAGTIAANADGFTAPTLPAATTTYNGLVTTPVWASGGGDITINVGRDIIGSETPADSDGSQTGGIGVSIGQFWSSWYYTAGKAIGSSTAPFDSSAGGIQNSAWINYATFFQGIGALGGGDITLNAGRNIYDISASLPETIQVSGGQSAGSAAVAHYYGGGNLLVQAGGDLYSSTFYVGRGTGRIVAGGDIVADPLNPVTGKATTVSTTYFNSGVPTIMNPSGGKTQSTAVPLLLAVQDGFISLQAPVDITLGGIFEPTRIPVDISKDTATMLPAGFGIGFDSYGSTSGVSLASGAGNIIVDALMPSLNGGGITDTLFTKAQGSLATASRNNLGITPATLDVRAILGDITIANSLYVIPSADGSITLAAGGDLRTYGLNSSGNPITNAVIMLDDTVASTISSAFAVPLYDILGTPTPTALASAVHADDSNPVILYAGEDISGAFTLIKSAKVQAGHDIFNTTFTGQNNNNGDITSVIAGRDILARQIIGASGQTLNQTSTFKLYGPGDFLVEAGRNLGPFTTYDAGRIASNPSSQLGGGILAVGDGSNSGGTVIPYLPVQGANITTLFGVGPGIDVAAAIANYVDPATANVPGINYLPDIANILGVSEDQAWATFQTLPPARQKLLVERAFLDFLTQVGLDYNNASSPYQGQYARAYQTIATLFPAGLGYTDNNTGGANGASMTVHTGDLRMAHSLIETQTGGDINILGPGGNAYVGSNAADTLSPSQQGILTLQGGTIRGYTDGSVQVYQSRIFTEQGGDVNLFSANGDLNAGKGPKSSAAYPPLRLICDVDGYCRVSPAGLVTGAGIGALLSIPGQDPTQSNAVLTAPHGTVDAGAAGIRVAGNLDIVALHVANAFNIDVQGAVKGIPIVAAVNTGALTSASAAATNAVTAAQDAVAHSREAARQALPSIFTVQILGFGQDSGAGGPAAAPPSAPNPQPGSAAYTPDHMVQVLARGTAPQPGLERLTADERARLGL